MSVKQREVNVRKIDAYSRRLLCYPQLGIQGKIVRLTAVDAKGLPFIRSRGAISRAVGPVDSEIRVPARRAQFDATGNALSRLGMLRIAKCRRVCVRHHDHGFNQISPRLAS